MRSIPAHAPPAQHRAQRPGFTLMEIITVLVLMGVLAAAVVSTVSDDDRTLPYRFNTLKTHIRFVQAEAMGLATELGIRCQGGSYWMYRGNNVNDRVALPQQDADTVSLGGVGISPSTFTIAFDDRGRPHSAAAQSDANLFNADQNFTLTKGGESQSFTVTRETGYIP